MKKTSLLLSKEGVIAVDCNNPKNRQLLSADHKRVPWMEDFFGRLSGPRALVFDVLRGTFASAKACLMTQHNFCLVLCEIDRNVSGNPCGEWKRRIQDRFCP